MKLPVVALASLALFATAAQAENTGLRAGVLLSTADGHRLGRIEDLTGPENAPTTARIIRDDHFIYVPVSTISQVDKSHFTTSLSYKDATK